MTLEDMPLSDASLTELVAELQERLRLFMTGFSTAADPVDASCSSVLHDEPGPLDSAGRVSLAARLLALALGQQQDSVSQEAAGAFDSLANALAAAPAPLPGSVLESGLRRMAGEFEALALAWDTRADRELRETWHSLRDLGDSLWSIGQKQIETVRNEQPKRVAAATTETSDDRLLWLLVSGRLRRMTLRRHLEEASWTVQCLGDCAEAVARLASERPAAFVCDDAAPARHAANLRRLLPPSSPPLIVVQCRVAGSGSGSEQLVWLPPFRIADLPGGLGR